MIVPALSTQAAAGSVTESATQDVKAQDSMVAGAVPRDEQVGLTDHGSSVPSPAISPSTDGTPEKLAAGSASAPERIELSMVSDRPQAALS